MSQGGDLGYVNVSSPIPALRKAVSTMLIRGGECAMHLFSIYVEMFLMTSLVVISE